MTNQNLAPVIFVPHGGGPLPLLNDPGHAELTSFFKQLGKNIKRPSAILMISAHWEEGQVSITSGSNPQMIYDYYGFPPESYTIKYPAPGEPELASTIYYHLAQKNIPVQLNEKRGFDHGMYVPLLLMYPEADIPTIQITIYKNMDPAKHIELGRALAEIRKSEDLLIIGSGMSFHNIPTFFSNDPVSNQRSEAFDKWLVDALTNKAYDFSKREELLNNWTQAPHARFSHPREDHLMPLLMCFGISEFSNAPAEVVYDGYVMGKKVSSFLWK